MVLHRWQTQYYFCKKTNENSNDALDYEVAGESSLSCGYCCYAIVVHARRCKLRLRELSGFIINLFMFFISSGYRPISHTSRRRLGSTTTLLVSFSIISPFFVSVSSRPPVLSTRHGQRSNETSVRSARIRSPFKINFYEENIQETATVTRGEKTTE